MKTFWDVFDCKCVLGFTGNMSRVKPMEAELKRVGMADVDWHFQIPNPFISMISKHCKVSRVGTAHPRYVNNVLGHYRMVKQALERGFSRGLFMEDDLVFLKDTRLVEQIVKELPQDADLVLFDSFSRKTPEDRLRFASETASARTRPRFYKRITRAYSAACYAMNRNAMARYCDCIEATVTKGATLVNSDVYFDTEKYLQGIVLYAATPNVAIQDVRLSKCRAGTYCVSPITLSDYNLRG